MSGSAHAPLELDAEAMPGDDSEATRNEALAIGRWAQEFASSLRDRNQ